MEKKDVSRVIKVGQIEFMNRLFYDGEMFFNTVESFARKDANKQRFDKLEGAMAIEQVKWLKLQAPDGKIYEFSKTDPKHTKLISAFHLTSDDSFKGNIYSCSGVTPDTIPNFQKLNAQFGEFGNAVVLIENPRIFFDKVERELKRRNFEYELGLVNYFNTDERNGSLSVFDKTDRLSYQNEIRIWIKNGDGKPVTIHIGSIKDISCKFLLRDLLKQESLHA